MKLEGDSDKQSTEPGEPDHVFSSYQETRVHRGSINPRQRNLVILVSVVALLVVLLSSYWSGAEEAQLRLTKHRRRLSV